MRLPTALAVTALALAPLTAAAQTAPAEPQFSAERVRAHVAFLADDVLEGRDAGTRGYDVAARYVATRFLALGLKPGGTDGGWYQQVPLARYSLDDSKPASVAIGAKRFANAEEVLVAASPRWGSDTQTVSAEAVFVGHGTAAEYAGLDVKGKFVVALLGPPKTLKGEAAAAAAAENKSKTAASRGAVGLLSLVTPDDLKANFPWDQAKHYLLRPQMDWLDAKGAPKGEDTGLQVSAYLKPAAAQTLFAGSPMTADQLFAAAAGTETTPKGFALKPRVTVQRTSQVAKVMSPTVIGMLPGSDPALASEYVMLTAHLDHDGVDPKLTGDQIYNGAMDNAAGTATMLEAARAFAESGARPKRPILFVALTAEEDGLLGSDYLAQHPVTGSGKVVANVNLDMPVLLYDFQDVVAFGAEHSTLGPIVERAGARMGVTLSPDPLPEENLFMRSDHYSFVKQGVPSVFLMTGFKNGGEAAFRDFLKTHYHKPSDQVSLPFDWEAGAKFARINYMIANEIANAPEAPRWYAGNLYGEKFAKDAPKAPKPAKAAATPAPAAN